MEKLPAQIETENKKSVTRSFFKLGCPTPNLPITSIRVGAKYSTETDLKMLQSLEKFAILIFLTYLGNV